MRASDVRRELSYVFAVRQMVCLCVNQYVCFAPIKYSAEWNNFPNRCVNAQWPSWYIMRVRLFVPTCAEPNCDRSFSRIKAVWIRPRTAPVSRIVENFGGGWRAGVGRGYDAKEKADRDRDRLHRRDRNRLSFLNGIRRVVNWQSAFSSLATGTHIVPTVASEQRRRCEIHSRA